jgi:hypothetical protein
VNLSAVRGRIRIYVISCLTGGEIATLEHTMNSRILHVLLLAAGLCSPLHGQVVINEFLATNDTAGLDSFQQSSDWIELFNPDLADVDLAGWTLTDEPDIPTKWTFPAVTLPAGGYLLVRASGKDLRVAGSELHTNFTLSASGEYLALRKPSSQVASVWQPFPRQFVDTSYSRQANGTAGYTAMPTPGAANSTVVLTDYVRDTKFTSDRGFFDNSVLVGVLTTTPGAEIRYTTDGTEPTATTGLVYSAPLTLTQTTVLKARAFKPGLVPTNTDTQTYIRVSDWLDQPAAPAGFPNNWGNNWDQLRRRIDTNVLVEPVYRMDTRVTADATLRAELTSVLKNTLPIVCVSGKVGDLFGLTGVIGNLRFEDTEVPVAVEYFDPQKPDSMFRTRATLQSHGAGVREYAKKALRLDFSGPKADGALKFPLFSGANTEVFDQLLLRSLGHDSFTANTRSTSMDSFDLVAHASYLRDHFLRKTEEAAGLITPRGRYVHLCINGLYWGLYDLMEKTPASLFAEATAATTPLQFDALMAKVGREKFVDHMLIRMWAGDHDWLGPIYMPRNDGQLGTTGNVAVYNQKNWYAIKRQRGLSPTEWSFFTWDAEISMGSHLLSNLSTLPMGLVLPAQQRQLSFDHTAVSTPNTPAQFWAALSSHPPFRELVGNRARRLFGAGGQLSPAVASARVQSLQSLLHGPMLAESARWGFCSTYNLRVTAGQLWRIYNTASTTFLTRDLHWLPEVNWLRDTFAQQRGNTLVSQLKARGLYPATDAPEVSPPGGRVNAFQITASSPTALVHYTTDGSLPTEASPVAPAGVISVATSPLRVQARALDGGVWSPVTDVTFSLALPVVPGDLAITEIHYNPTIPGFLVNNPAVTNADQLEFLEITNLSNHPVSLSNVVFADGIDFDFAAHSSVQELAGRKSIVIAAKPAAVELIAAAGSVVGAFANGTRLANGGERIKLVTTEGVTLLDFRYDDQDGWPSTPDGGGYSLVYIVSQPVTNMSDPVNWQPSLEQDGDAGSYPYKDEYYWVWITQWFPSTMPQADFTQDPDGDGIPNIVEFLCRTRAGEADESPIEITVDATTVEMAFSSRIDLVGLAKPSLETSTDMVSWTRHLLPAVREAGTGMARQELTMPRAVPGNRLYVRIVYGSR